MQACATLFLLIVLAIFGTASIGVLGEMEGVPGEAVVETEAPISAGYFTADTTVIPAGGCVTLSWSKPGAESVLLLPGNGPAGYQETVASTGATTVCPSAALNYVPGVPVDYTLITTYPDGVTTTEIITITYLDTLATFTPTAIPIGMIPSVPPPPPPVTALPSTPDVTPLPLSISVHFQNFERGFMVQLAGQDCVYIFGTSPNEGIVMPDPGTGYQYCTPVAGLPDNALTAAPPGLIAPDGDFGKVWGYYIWVNEAIGFATAEDFYYDGVIPPSERVIDGGVFYSPVITLPDGRQLYCGSRGATASTCLLR